MRARAALETEVVVFVLSGCVCACLGMCVTEKRELRCGVWQMGSQVDIPIVGGIQDTRGKKRGRGKPGQVEEGGEGGGRKEGCTTD